MLEVFARIINSLTMVIVGFYIIKEILQNKSIKLNCKNLLIMLLSVFVSTIIYRDTYAGINTIIIFLFNIMIYKIIFKITLNESTIVTSILMTIIFVAEFVLSIIFMPFISIQIVRTNFIFSLVSNFSVEFLCVLILKVRPIKKQLIKFYNNIIKQKVISVVVFFTLLIIGFSFLFYNIGLSNFLDKDYLINLITMIIFITLTFIFIYNKNEYKKLSNEYDSLFTYIQNFEEWIEKEQLNRHEYKNQLAVIRCLTKEKKVKNKIDEILEDNINIEDQAVTNLKNLPKGGIKGLMYYKAAIAQKQKIHLTTDVSINENGILSRLSKKDIRVLCKLIGIYFDNAIEAASESKKKNLTIEVYELKDRVNFVFSNTFKNHTNMKDRNKKGVSSKGTGRGNGLYFAGKLIQENSGLEEKQEIIDNYYIQQLTIKKDSK